MSVEPELRPGGAAALGEHIGAVLDRLGDGITVQGPGGELVYANEAGARLCGFDSPEELLSTPLPEVLERFELFDDEGNPFDAGLLPGRLALQGQCPPETVIRVRDRRSGATRWSLVQALPVTDEAGELLFAVNLLRDVTESTEAAERQRFLARASALLASSLDYETILVDLAELAAPALADWCVVWLVDDEGKLRALTWAHGNPDRVRLAEKTSRRYPPAGEAIERVIDSGEPVLVPEITDDMLVEAAYDDEHLPLLGEAEPRSFLAVPLAGRERVYGALALISTDPGRVFDEGDLALATDLGRRAAVAIENALLLRRAEDSAERADIQNEVGRVLAEATDEEGAIDRILESVCRRLGWDVGQLWRFGDDGRTLRAARLWRRPELETAAFERDSRDHSFARGSGLPGRVWASGELAWIPDVLADPVFARGPAAAEAGLRSALAVPLLLAGEVVGVVEFLSRDLRRPNAALATTLAAIGSQLGLFLERVRAEREREQLLDSERAAREAAEQAAHILAKLEEVTQAALRHVVSGDILDEMLRQITRLVDADTSAILLVDEDGRFLTVRAALGFDREIEHAVPIPFGHGMAGRVAASGKPVVIRDLAEVELVSPHLRERGVKSLVAIPITIGNQVIGVAHAGSLQPSRFDEEDVRLLSLMADRIALAITQAHAYDDERMARHEVELAHRRLSFLAEASTLLAASLDYESTLRAVARLAVPHLADWCVVDVALEGEELERIAVAHVDQQKVSLVRDLERRWPQQPSDPNGPYAVLRSGTPELSPEVTEDLILRTAQDEEHLAALRDLGLRSYMCVPMWGRDRVLGALTFVASESERSYTEADLALAEELARRAAVAMENALLYRQVEERARAARVLDAVADGVFLVDARGVVLLWNHAAEAITGLAAEQVVGHTAAEAIPGWAAVAPRVPVVSEVDRAVARAETVPLEVGDRELWLSISGVGFADGTVYAFRDLTQDRMLEELKADFVSTVSHELRTPLAAVYGAAMTLRRRDFAADEEQRGKLLSVIVQESERLATIVNDILWASRLDAESMRFSIQSCNAEALAHGVIDAANVHRPANIEIVLRSPEELPRVAADPDKVRQVLVNLLDNAIKYSPDGGRIEIELTAGSASVRLTVHDEGLGVPPTEQRRIFEKFYRLDPNLTRGVGGTGLGLYICRELVHRMNGRIWMVSPRTDGRGSTFAVELPIAQHQV
jgi:PAS domain S-box-containing protein